MLGLDISETCEVKVLGKNWTIGCIPWGKLEAMRIALAGVSAPMSAASAKMRAALDAKESSAADAAFTEYQLCRIPYIEAAGEIVRWGVRSTPVEGLNALPLLSEVYAGHPCPVLDPRIVAAITRVGLSGDAPIALVDMLAAHVLERNSVSYDDLLGFK